MTNSVSTLLQERDPDLKMILIFIASILTLTLSVYHFITLFSKAYSIQCSAGWANYACISWL